MSVSVLCGLRGPAEAAVVRALDAGPGLRVTRRCADLVELLAAGEAGHGSVAVVSAGLDGLDRRAVRHLQECGVQVVVLLDAPVPGALGEDAAAIGPEDTVGAVLDLIGGTPARPPVHAAPDVPDRGGDGRLVAVWGPTGAPGRTTLAVSLAATLARQGRSVLLADVDPYGGAVAPVLGVLEEGAGVAGATRAAARGRLEPAVLAALTPVTDAGLRLLPGLSRPQRWPEVEPAALEEVWRTARLLAEVVVADCGFCLESDEVLSYDTRAPQRNGATLATLAAADHVIAVGAADPIGLPRLVRGLADLRQVTSAPTTVVVNRVRAAAAGPRPEKAVADALRRHAGIEEVHVLPDDPRSCDQALLHGRAVAEHAPGSPLARGVSRLVDHLLPALGTAH